MEGEIVRAFRALHSLQSKMKVLAENRRECHYLSNEKKDYWIKDYVDRQTTVARKPDQDAETAIIQGQEDMRNA